MTYQKFISLVSEKFEGQPVEVLQEAVKLANDNLELDADVFDGLLAALESRMSADDFVTFCETL